ncbi:hypothetical protein D6817_00760 [Candidatus Pacearchaeota archaeon]|nr:MAG: hypothetical protein D6817_00760 [Candidatus Pacearchaeota archaeon]
MGSKLNGQDWEVFENLQRVIGNKLTPNNEIEEALRYFKEVRKHEEAYKVVREIAHIEKQLTQETINKFQPLLRKLRKVLFFDESTSLSGESSE